MLKGKQLYNMSILFMALVVASAIITLTEVRNLASVQGQGNLTAGNITVTPEQKAAMCDPNNPKLRIVNTTESKICGIPTNTTSAANATTGAEAPPSTLPPSTATPTSP
jgi:hypothetical protein